MALAPMANALPASTRELTDNVTTELAVKTDLAAKVVAKPAVTIANAAIVRVTLCVTRSTTGALIRKC